MGQDVAPCPALGADSSTCLPEFTGFAEELPRVEWTCSSPSALAIVNGISVTAGQENLGRPAGGNKRHWRSRQAHGSCAHLSPSGSQAKRGTDCQLSKGSGSYHVSRAWASPFILASKA